MIQSIPNALCPYYMASFDIEITHAKLLNYLKKRKNKVEKSKITFYSGGKTINLKGAIPIIEDLKKENAVLDDNQTVSITNKGLELLQNNLHLLKRKPDKIHANKGIPTPHDIHILKYLTKRVENKTIYSFTINCAVEELNLSKQIISRRIKRLKDAGYLDFEPRKYNTIKILKNIND